ncbi:MAG: hypothetical protein WCA31_05950, partial [Acidimicrobiales bacterium]
FRLAKMGKYWDQFRERASRKEERSHFGLAWSVFAGYWLAGAVLLRSLHEVGWLVTLADVGVALFFVFGAFGVYLAFAVPMRWWPHQPAKPNEAALERMEKVFIRGLTLIQDWGKTTKMSQVVYAPGDDSAQRYDALSQKYAQGLIAWIQTSEKDVLDCLGQEIANRYKMSPELTKETPQWADDTIWVGLYPNVMSRLSWVRNWSQGQFDL